MPAFWENEAAALIELGNKKKIELAITGIGVIALIFLGINQIINRRDRSRPVPTDKPYPTSEVARMATSEVGADNVKWGRDPFLMNSSSAKEQGIGGLILNGIVSDKDSPYAIINNEIVKLGDKVSGMTVIEINEKNVVLDENGQRHTLELNVY